MLELNSVVSPAEVQINAVTQNATKQKPEGPKPTCQHCKKRGQYRNQCQQLEREKTKPKTTQLLLAVPIKTTVVRKNLTPTTNMPTPITQTTEMTENKDLFTHPTGSLGKPNNSTEKCYFGAIAANRPPSWSTRLMGRTQSQQRDTLNNTEENF